jgi:rhodanese-related sulfurtransferase
MHEIEAATLKTKFDDGDEFKLVAIMSEFGFDGKHIAGSIHASSREEIEAFDPADPLVLYCSDVDCFASKWAARTLEEAGFTNVTHFAGGLSAWEDAGYPLEGRLAH